MESRQKQTTAKTAVEYRKKKEPTQFQYLIASSSLTEIGGYHHPEEQAKLDNFLYRKGQLENFLYQSPHCAYNNSLTPFMRMYSNVGIFGRGPAIRNEMQILAKAQATHLIDHLQVMDHIKSLTFNRQSS